MDKDDLETLAISWLYDYLRPTNPDDVAHLERLAERGLLRKGSGPVKGDARCGFYWIITEQGREVLDADAEP